MINNAATSFGGAFTSFAGSNLAFTASEFSDNVSGFYGGGLLALYGNATVTFSKINRNRFVPQPPVCLRALPPRRSPPLRLQGSWKPPFPLGHFGVFAISTDSLIT